MKIQRPINLTITPIPNNYPPRVREALAALDGISAALWWGDEAEARATGKPPKIPSFLTSGGGANSCYMWREDGPLVQIRFRSSE